MFTVNDQPETISYSLLSNNELEIFVTQSHNVYNILDEIRTETQKINELKR